jgi:integrase
MTTPVWLQERIPKFIEQLKPLTDEILIRDLCERELKIIRMELGLIAKSEDEIITGFSGKVTSLHTYLTDYRNAIKEQINCTPENSYEIIIGKFKSATSEGSRRRIRLHYSHRYLKKSQDESQYRNQGIKESSDLKRRNPRYFYSQDVIKKAIELLDSKNYSNLALGLMLLTGRRMSEILFNGNFEYISDDRILFSGQLKTRESPTAKTYPFPIPVLYDAKKIIEAVARLRCMPSVAELKDVKSCNSKADTIGKACKTHFKNLIKDCIPKDLRAAYAQICLVYKRKEKRTDYEPYFADILGHATDDLDTSKKYKIFELLD